MRPNIVLIITDQQAGMAMSCAGANWLRTPNLDRLASWGTQFTHAYCANPHSLPSRACMFTGQYSSRSKMRPQQFPSLGKQLADSGYSTAYFGKWHIGKSKPDRDRPWHGFQTCEVGVIDSETSAAAVKYIKNQARSPFFSVVSFLNPHDCCEYARELGGFKDRIHMRNGEIDTDPPLSQCPPVPENFAIPDNEPEALQLIREKAGWRFFHPGAGWDEARWRQYRWGYGRLVEKVDAEIGKVLDALESANLAEDTLILFTADHGDGAAAHHWNQKLAFYDESVRVPLLAAWKGKTAGGKKDDRLVNVGIDLLPTVCDYAAIEAAHEGAGVSFHQGAKQRGHEYVISEVDLPIQGCMVRTDRHKYIYYKDGKNPEMLFDCQDDPGELVNRIGDDALATEVGRCRQIAKRHIQSQPNSGT
jgi:choline-sulfatase